MNAERISAHWKRLPHPLRWIMAACVGGTLVVVGLLLLVLPGPGIPILILGLLVLATEFAWAEMLLRRVRQHGAGAGRMAREAARRVSRRRAPTIET